MDRPGRQRPCEVSAGTGASSSRVPVTISSETITRPNLHYATPRRARHYVRVPMRSVICFVAVLFAAEPAHADEAAGTACAKTLSPAALMIYRAAAPDLRAGTNLVLLLTAKVKPMVFSRKLSITAARPAAEAAADCLRALRR